MENNKGIFAKVTGPREQPDVTVEKLVNGKFYLVNNSERVHRFSAKDFKGRYVFSYLDGVEFKELKVTKEEITNLRVW